MLVAERAAEIRVLRRQGKNIREIARLLDVSRNTVRRDLRSEGLPHYEREQRPGKLQPYRRYIAERVKPPRRGARRRPTSRPSGADPIGSRCSSRRSAGGGQPTSSSSPMNG